MNFDILDQQMQPWATRLRDDLRIDVPESNRLATTIAQEVAALTDASKQEARDASPILLSTRIEELVAFQGFMDRIAESSAPPAVMVRAQVVSQNYICFVYLGESCFHVLKKVLPAGSAGRKCCKFLTDNPVRAFRNAVAHANWRYASDFSGLLFWARKGASPDEGLTEFEVSQQDLGFWQAVARITAYSCFLSL